MAAFINLTNIIIDFENVDRGTFSVEDFTSFDYSKVNKFLNTLDSSYFKWRLCEDNDKLERISYEIYGSEKYWDVLLLINNKNPLFDMTYNHDTLELLSEDRVVEYQKTYSQGVLSDRQYLYLKNIFLSEMSKKNDTMRYIKYIPPILMNDFLNKCYDEGIIL